MEYSAAINKVYHFFVLQDIKVFSEDGTCKVVEILADTTARDLCQLLVYKSHCVDDNSWALVEHHPLIGLGNEGIQKGNYIKNLNFQ